MLLSDFGPYRHKNEHTQIATPRASVGAKNKPDDIHRLKSYYKLYVPRSLWLPHSSEVFTQTLCTHFIENLCISPLPAPRWSLLMLSADWLGQTSLTVFMTWYFPFPEPGLWPSLPPVAKPELLTIFIGKTGELNLCHLCLLILFNALLMRS